MGTRPSRGGRRVSPRASRHFGTGTAVIVLGEVRPIGHLLRSASPQGADSGFCFGAPYQESAAVLTIRADGLLAIDKIGKVEAVYGQAVRPSRWRIRASLP